MIVHQFWISCISRKIDTFYLVYLILHSCLRFNGIVVYTSFVFPYCYLLLRDTSLTFSLHALTALYQTSCDTVVDHRFCSGFLADTCRGVSYCIYHCVHQFMLSYVACWVRYSLWVFFSEKTTDEEPDCDQYENNIRTTGASI